MGDGDGWVQCTAGHRHWGRFGAAGLLINDGTRSVLQHRAPWTHEGDTWGLPGGARDSHEDPVATALREAHEEAAITSGAVVPHGMWIDDHGGWSYTTVVARPGADIFPRAANAESTDIRWWDDDQVDSLPLHTGFAGAWPLLRAISNPVRVIVDAANVVGSQPDGWWRDRLGASRRLRDRLHVLVRDGIEVGALPAGIDPGLLSVLLPQVELVVEGAATDTGQPEVSRWWSTAVSVHAADADGDSAVVARAAAALHEGDQVVVVTADRGLRERLPPDAVTIGPSWLLDLISG